MPLTYCVQHIRNSEHLESRNILNDAFSLLIVAILMAILMHTFNLNNEPKYEDLKSMQEASDLLVIDKSDDLNLILQATKDFRYGRWVSDNHMLVEGRREDQQVSFKLPTNYRGEFDIFVFLTKAKDFGIIQNFINGKVVGPEIDLLSYEKRVQSTGRVSLGKVHLAGNDIWTIKVIGTNPHSEWPHYQFGIDGIVLGIEK